VVNYGGKRVLILGGTGFIGGRLAERLLLEQGAQVRVAVRDWRKATWISRTKAELVAGDVMSLESMTAAIHDCDVVFHCASGPAESGGYMRTNSEGTDNVIAACVQANVSRLVYVSTVAVHGTRPGMKLSSASPLHVSGRDYSDSKVAAEQLVSAAQVAGHLNTVIVRPTYVWGPRSSIFTIRQVREMMSNRFRYVDDGEAVANAVYVDNLVDALLSAGVKPGVEGRRFLITDGANYRWRDLFGKYATFLGVDSFPSVSSRSSLSHLGSRAVDFTDARLAALLGPRTLPVRAIRRLVKISNDRLRSKFVDSWELNKLSFNEVADIDDARQALEYSPRFDLDAGMSQTLRWLDDQMGFELSQWRSSRS
jgi:nucleoside-diphosphate-sugar epimerase